MWSRFRKVLYLNPRKQSSSFYILGRMSASLVCRNCLQTLLWSPESVLCPGLFKQSLWHGWSLFQCVKMMTSWYRIWQSSYLLHLGSSCSSALYAVTPSEEGVSQCTRDSYQPPHWSMCAVLASDWSRAERGKCDGHGVKQRLWLLLPVSLDTSQWF